MILYHLLLSGGFQSDYCSGDREESITISKFSDFNSRYFTDSSDYDLHLTWAYYGGIQGIAPLIWLLARFKTGSQFLSWRCAIPAFEYLHQWLSFLIFK